MVEKRLYSLSLGAYIMTVTGLKPEVKLDEETNTAYMIYPETPEVAGAIKEFRIGEAVVSLVKYNANVRYIKAEFKKLTNPVDFLKHMFAE